MSNSGRDLVEAYAAQLAAGDAEVLGVLRGIEPYTATTALGGKGRVWNVNIWALPAEQNGPDVSNRYEYISNMRLLIILSALGPIGLFVYDYLEIYTYY